MNVTMTEKIKDLFYLVSNLDNLDLKAKEAMSRNDLDYKKIKFIAFEDVKHVFSLARSLQPQGQETIYLHELLEGSSIYVESPQEILKSPELLKRLDKLRKDEDQRSYNKMVKDITRENKFQDIAEIGVAVRTTSQQLTTVINYVLSVVCCFAFAWYASVYTWNDVAFRLIFSIIVASVVALAELYFFAKSEV